MIVLMDMPLDSDKYMINDRKEVRRAEAGQECGVAFNEDIDFKEGDIIESLG